MDTNITLKAEKPKARPMPNGAWLCWTHNHAAGGIGLRDAYARWQHRMGPSGAFIEALYRSVS